MMDTSTVFDQHTVEYDQWYERHATLYESELEALKRALPSMGEGVEIGVGTGRFAAPLGIKTGVEPSENMALMAEQRGVKVHRAYAEKLPFENQSFDFALMVTTLCFVSDVSAALSEVHRILRPGGCFIAGIIDRESPLGRQYEAKKEGHAFYNDAHFLSTAEATALMQKAGFHTFSYWQTLFHPEKEQKENPETGYGKGSFAVIKAFK